MMIVILIGSFGFRIIESYSWLEAVYMTIITVSTIGFMEVKPLSDAGRIFTIFLIAANFTVIAYLVSVVSGYLFDGEFRKDYQLYKMKKQIEELKNHCNHLWLWPKWKSCCTNAFAQSCSVCSN